MQEFDKIGEDLFNKIRGRFPSITIGNEAGEVINEPSQARFFDFEYKESEKVLQNYGVIIIFPSGQIATKENLKFNTKAQFYDSYSSSYRRKNCC